MTARYGLTLPRQDNSVSPCTTRTPPEFAVNNNADLTGLLTTHISISEVLEIWVDIAENSVNGNESLLVTPFRPADQSQSG